MTTISTSPSSLGSPSPSTDLSAFDLLLLCLLVRWARLTRWEFWSPWAIYLLLVPHFVRLALRHRSATVFTAANPGMPLGGLVGESKWDILQRLPAEAIIPSALLKARSTDGRSFGHRDSDRLRDLATLMTERQWKFPIVLKPDVGERGTDVALIRNREEAGAYLASHPLRLIVQEYHPGPYEAGVFYVRRPDENKGRIFSITDKRLPAVLGDGASSIRTLIWKHPRLRLQVRSLLQQLGSSADRVPARGESVLLSIAGNHCRGTLFLDGAALATPKLTEAIDAISQRFDGFFFGRFDIRYTDPQAFSEGRGFRIVELNGVLSESTNIYDPSRSLFSGLCTLAAQWSLAFEIGEANVTRGIRSATIAEVVRAIRADRVRKNARDRR
ncbi:MAG: hypothetical protein KF805_00330 [Phycisphaeraceae bacterium]|nr:hypothetical protein [Phycisphaeraceae bacterium]